MEWIGGGTFFKQDWPFLASYGLFLAFFSLFRAPFSKIERSSLKITFFTRATHFVKLIGFLSRTGRFLLMFWAIGWAIYTSWALRKWIQAYGQIKK